MAAADSRGTPARAAKSSTRRRRIILGIVAVSIISAGALYSYDRDAIKGIPVVGRLPWRLLIGNTAAQPVSGQTERGVRDSHLQDLAEARRRSPKVLFIGDSITANWLQEGREIWEAQFVPLGAAAVGGRGDRIQNLLFRIHAGEFAGFQPQAVVLLIGTNNVNRNSPEEIDEAIAIVVDEFQHRWVGADILVVAIPPRELPRSREVLERVRDANVLLAERYASRRNVTFVADWRAFLGTDDWIDARLFSPEGVHLTPRGYEVLAGMVRPALIAALNSH